MAANAFDAEIRKFLPLLGNEEKNSLLTIMKSFLHIKETAGNKNDQKKSSSSIDYSKYRFPVSAIKFNRDKINEWLTKFPFR